MMKKEWWKLLSILCIVYALVGGMIMKVPELPILYESIRNLFYHVPMWFSMMIIMLISLIYSIKYLGSSDMGHDIIAEETARTGIVFGFLGLATGSLWAKFTWGTWWVTDPKLNGAAITLLIYLAYIVLRGSINEEQSRARVSAVYNIFAYVMLFVFLWIYPRMNNVDSLHPGNGGNPGFSVYEKDLDSSLRIIFYPSIIGWTLLGVWIFTIRVRLHKIEREYQLNSTK